MKHKSHQIVAEVLIPEKGAEGMLFTQGGRFAGYGLYVQDGKLTYHYNLAGVERYTVTSTESCSHRQRDAEDGLHHRRRQTVCRGRRAALR